MSQDTALDRKPVPLRFTVPDHFTVLPLDAEPEDRVRSTYQRALRTMPAVADSERVQMVFMQELLLAKLIEEGAVYAALCVCRSEAQPATLSTAQFAIFVKHVDMNGERPLAAVAGGLRNPGDPRETAFVQFPAGEGLVVGDEVKVTVPITPAGRRESTTTVVRQAQIMLPFPDKRKLAVLSMSTASREDWLPYSRILNDIAHSVSFTEMNTSISDRLSGLL